MNPSFITPSNIMFGLGLVGLAFTIWGKITDPQAKSDKTDALIEQRQQWEKESNERRFSDIQKSIGDAFLLAQNHTHTVDVKVDGLTKTVGELNTSVTRLATIIDERIPKK